jgi:glycyl-tRNA synthetase beta chain
MSTAPLLIELLTEELPPKALWKLAQAFCDALLAGLKQHKLVADTASVHPFATPRRLAVRIEGVRQHQEDSQVRRRGPAVASAYTPEHQPTPALLGFLKSCSTTIESLTQEEQNGHLYFFFEAQQKGQSLVQLLSGIVDQAIKKLPIPKVMRWGNNSERFVRPVHRLIVLYGKEIIPIQLLGCTASRETEGHRFLAQSKPILIQDPHHYEATLKQEGHVIADYEERRALIRSLLDSAKASDETIIMPEALIDEVCGLVEYPVVLRGHFDHTFLQIPKEVLILSMQTHQRYFAIENQEGALKSTFLLISNMQTNDPSHIINGNQRVLRARLSDARFFFEHDLKTALKTRTQQLEQVIYHQQLGTQAERIQRVKHIAHSLYQPFYEALRASGAPAPAPAPTLLDETIDLAKADLVSDMVGEFPELQGVIGSYYAQHEQAHPSVVQAIREQYQLKFDGLSLHPESLHSSLLSLLLRVADRLETLVGLYGIGLIPTGDKDPFALRRCAFVLLDGLEWCCDEALAGRLNTQALPHVHDWITIAWNSFKPGTLTIQPAQIIEFMHERLRQRLTQTFSHTTVEAVLSSSASLTEARLRVQALSTHIHSPALLTLAQAHKRIQNLLKKADNTSLAAIKPELFQENSEQQLWSTLQTVQPICQQQLDALQIEAAFNTLAQLAEPVDQFFNTVMIMVDQIEQRTNRLALLSALDRLIQSIACLARLA